VSEKIAEFTPLAEKPKISTESLKNRKKVIDVVVDNVLKGDFPSDYIAWDQINREFDSLIRDIQWNMEGA